MSFQNHVQFHRIQRIPRWFGLHYPQIANRCHVSLLSRLATRIHFWSKAQFQYIPSLPSFRLWDRPRTHASLSQVCLQLCDLSLPLFSLHQFYLWVFLFIKITELTVFVANCVLKWAYLVEQEVTKKTVSCTIYFFNSIYYVNLS